MSDQTPKDKPLSRREFLKLAGVAAGVAAGLSLGTDILSQEDTSIKNNEGSSDESEKLYLQKIEAFEAEMAKKYPQPIFPEIGEKKITLNEFNNILNQDRISTQPIDTLLDFGSGKINPNILSQETSSIIVPFLQISETAGLKNVLTQDNLNMTLRINWTNFFHWTNHAAQSGRSVYDIVNYGRYLHGVVNGAMEGNGLILYRPETILPSGSKLQKVIYL